MEVCWLRGHEGQVLKALVYLSGRLVCEALPKPVAKRSRLEALGDKVSEKNFTLMERYKNTVRGWARRHKNEIEKLVVVDNRVRTLNSKFQIPWAIGLSPSGEPDEIPGETEVLDTPEEDLGLGLTGLETECKRTTLLDRY